MKTLIVTLSIATFFLSACGRRNVPATTDAAAARDGTPTVDTASTADAHAPGFCATNAECVGNQYCHFDGGCAATGAKMGRCTARPSACNDIYAPVCGCDDKTYGNSCDAHAKGVNVKSNGACGAACKAINDAYRAEVAKAKSCCAMCAALQCTNPGKTELGCPCPTFLNVAPTTKMKQLEQDWKANRCGMDCDASVCPAPRGGSCQFNAPGGPATCKDMQGP